MEVITAADDNRRKAAEIIAKLHLKEELSDLEYALESIIDPEIWGGDEWSKDFIKQVEQDIEKIQKFRKRIREMIKRY